MDYLLLQAWKRVAVQKGIEIYNNPNELDFLGEPWFWIVFIVVGVIALAIYLDKNNKKK